MDDALALLQILYPPLALIALLVALVVAASSQARRLEKHAEWLRLLDTRVHNLHNEKREAYKRSLQILKARPNPARPTERHPEPPPLDTQKTLEVSEEMLLTLRLESKPPKEEE